jgi:hypothetical protein
MTNQYVNKQLTNIERAFLGINEITYGEAKRKLTHIWLMDSKLHGCSSRNSQTNPDIVLPKLGFLRFVIYENRSASHFLIQWRREQ